MGLFGKKKSKKKATHGKFERIEIDGKTIPIMNFYLYTNKNDNNKYIELTSKDAVEELHFSEITMDVILATKKLKIDTEFVDAVQKGKFKLYKFRLKNISEYYI